MAKFSHIRFYTLLAVVALTAACVPRYLAKYRSSDPKSNVQSESSGYVVGDQRTTVDGVTKKPEPKRKTIYALDENTFRFALSEDEVWDSALNVLLRNYNLNIVDRASGVATTEWDSYYLDSKVYRTKVSIRVRRISRSYVDVLVYNNVEQLHDGSSAGTVGAVWLPAKDGSKEVGRLVQNMALLLNQPAPVMPSAMAAGANTTKGDQYR